MKKYPRTPHIPCSPGATSDDKRLSSYPWEGMKVVITEKRDGENTTIRKETVHARSVENSFHVSREWIRRVHGAIAHELPINYRFCGENLYAKHSIGYENLSSWFELFGIFNDETNKSLAWNDVVFWYDIINSILPDDLKIGIVPVLYEGIFDMTVVDTMISHAKANPTIVEGFVVRPYDSFGADDFGTLVGKWVRPNHVQTDKHWTQAEVVVNGRV